MNIRIIEDAACDELEVTFRCSRIDQHVTDAIARLRMADMKLTGFAAGETRIVPVAEVLYIESVDKRTFFYTNRDSYETRLRLYEMAEMLEEADFVRASKSCLVNFSKVVSIRPGGAGRLIVALESGDLVQISRQYAPDIKRKLGM